MIFYGVVLHCPLQFILGNAAADIFLKEPNATLRYKGDAFMKFGLWPSTSFGVYAA